MSPLVPLYPLYVHVVRGGQSVWVGESSGVRRCAAAVNNCDATAIRPLHDSFAIPVRRAKVARRSNCSRVTVVNHCCICSYWRNSAVADKPRDVFRGQSGSPHNSIC